MSQPVDFDPPSSPADRKAIRDAIIEMSQVIQKQKDNNSAMKDITDDLKEKFKLPPKIAKAMAKTYFKSNYQDVLAESSTFEVAYENVMGSDAE